MDRRKFLKASSTLIAGANIPLTLSAQSEMKVESGRMILPMNRGWLYSPTRIDGAHERGFEDGGFQKVVIPHTNIRLPWHSFDDKEYEFISVYRRHFKLPAEAKGKCVFVDFEGVMVASKVWINGKSLGEYKGGYTPFCFDLTPHVDADGDNVLAVEVDSTERADIPPFGDEVDYMTFGGIYREVSLRIAPKLFIENMVARTHDVLSDSPKLDVEYYLQNEGYPAKSIVAEAALIQDGRVIGTAKQEMTIAVKGNDPQKALLSFVPLKSIDLWHLDHPHLYTLRLRLLHGDTVIDEDSRRFGFRDASFTDHGFSLNGNIIKLRGLDRHQTFPFVGQAMPARVQKRDAALLKEQLNCNIVRTSHYPQSRHFLDACDEMGLLVLEEIPGWQHIGPLPWQDISVDNVSRMIRRDWNHPSIILWGVRINESRDNHDFYTRTNAMAHKLDPWRQTGGIRYFQESEFLEDVFTMNDFGWPLKAPNHPRYLNTEFVGHTYPVKQIDDDQRQRELTIRHARVHDTLASNPQYSGGIAWCAFDYNTHANFGAGDRICYHGVADIFREPKPAAGFYRSQIDPEKEIVLEPAFHWALGDEALHFQTVMICSNCDYLKLYLVNDGKSKLYAEGDADRKQFPHLKYAPFSFNIGDSWEFGDLRIEGYLKGKLVATRQMSGRGSDQKFVLLPDDLTLVADGADTTRVVMRVTDEFGNIRPLANDPIMLTLEGPAELIGDNPFGLFGGRGAVWIRARESAGRVRLTAKHPRLGEQTIEVTITPAVAEVV
jgi:beta-galactosidase